MILIAGTWSSAWAQTEEELIAVAQASTDALNAHDFEQFATYFADDFIADNVAIPPPLDKETFLNVVVPWYTATPGIYHFQKQYLVSGNIMVFDECGFINTHPETGMRYTTFHMDIIEFEGYKMKKMTSFQDRGDELVALGVIEPPLPFPPPAPSFTLPDAEPTGMAPFEAQAELQSRWNTHDLSLYAKMIRSDAEILISPLIDPVGRDPYIAWQELWFLAVPDVHMEPVRTYDLGDGWVISEVVWTGTNEGPYLESSGTGNSIDLRVGFLARYDADGLITNLKWYFDSMTILNQLGLDPVTIHPTAVVSTSWGEVKSRFRE